MKPSEMFDRASRPELTDTVIAILDEIHSLCVEDELNAEYDLFDYEEHGQDPEDHGWDDVYEDYVDPYTSVYLGKTNPEDNSEINLLCIVIEEPRFDIYLEEDKGGHICTLGYDMRTEKYFSVDKVKSILKSALALRNECIQNKKVD